MARRPPAHPFGAAFLLLGLLVALAAVGTALLAAASPADAATRTPVVFFPGYGTTVLDVEVDDQRSVKGCPASGSFQDGIPASPGTTYDQVCRDRLITPRWRLSSRRPFPQRFSLPQGVEVTIPDYGKTASTPVYGALFDALEKAGYEPDRDLVVAGYNFRLTPDLDRFLARTKRLIVRTWRRNGKRPVRLVGHSNGPLYAQYLLTHVSAKWKRKHIQGFTSIAGNLPGQGALWTWVFTGVEIPGVFALPTTVATARSSARLMARSPATWMSASDPAVFGRREVVIRDASTGRDYTPADTHRLLRDAGLDRLAPLVRHYLGFVKFAGRRHFPNVDVAAEKGSGLPTQVGIVLPDLTRGQVVDPAEAEYISLLGDGNEEFITNDAVRVWRKMSCHRFRLTDNPGVSHLDLASDPAVVDRLLADLERPRKRCSADS